mmetsp:Transcript_21903/g.67988  ORF Transcript_21903/g.67988 Transcript_21903/m.67988 type:complete len:328 (-) Transcript_21903:431-1414(-)
MHKVQSETVSRISLRSKMLSCDLGHIVWRGRDEARRARGAVKSAVHVAHDGVGALSIARRCEAFNALRHQRGQVFGAGESLLQLFHDSTPRLARAVRRLVKRGCECTGSATFALLLQHVEPLATFLAFLHVAERDGDHARACPPRQPHHVHRLQPQVRRHVRRHARRQQHMRRRVRVQLRQPLQQPRLRQHAAEHAEVLQRSAAHVADQRVSRGDARGRDHVVRRLRQLLRDAQRAVHRLALVPGARVRGVERGGEAVAVEGVDDASVLQHGGRHGVGHVRDRLHRVAEPAVAERLVEAKRVEAHHRHALALERRRCVEKAGSDGSI